MKNRLSKLFVILLLFAPSLVFAQYYSYSKRNGQVYYDGKIIHGADSHSFCDLGYGYGKDRNHVYRYGTILEYVDPSFFRVDRRFSADNRPSHGRPDGGHHHCDRPGYYVSTFDVSYNGEKISGAASNSFVILKEEYAKDAFNVYWMGKKFWSVNFFLCLSWKRLCQGCFQCILGRPQDKWSFDFIIQGYEGILCRGCFRCVF